MKRKLFCLLLALEAAACVALCFVKGTRADMLSAALAFPFAQIGLGLRALSLSGRLGNAAALTLYAGLCLLPAGCLLIAKGKRKLRAEDALLVLVSALLFFALYLTANPGEIGALFPPIGESGLAAGKAMVGGTVYSALVGYAALRALRLSSQSGTGRLYGFLEALLALMNLVFVWAVFYVCFGDMLGAFSSLRAGNAGSESGLGPSYVFAALGFLADALPYALDVATAFIAAALVREMKADRYSDATVRAAQKLSRWCAGALAAVVVANVGFNVLQLVFAKILRNLDSTLSLPLVSILFVLAALAFARIAAEDRRLKEDSDLII
jgi:hypothetical protein